MDNEAVIYDAAPVIRNDRTLVPIRIVTETLGGKVDWNGVTKEVTLNIDGKEIKMTVGKTLEKYGVAPVIIDGRTFVPVRFVADELGATVAWDDATKTVTIAKIEK
ncbi:MAG: copper amine oxidase N-terminal domain-containing protein [Anaerotignum faecicola]